MINHAVVLIVPKVSNYKMANVLKIVKLNFKINVHNATKIITTVLFAEQI